MENTLLNLIPSSYIPEVHLSQYDVGRSIPFKLMDGNSEYSVPSGANIKILATKPSGLGFEVACTFSGNIVTLVNTETMSNEAGRFRAELRITSGNVILGTSNFIMNVERSPHPEGTIDGDAEALLPELTLLVERIENSNARIESMTASATTLATGEDATAEYDSENNQLVLGLPRGEKGEQGEGVASLEPRVSTNENAINVLDARMDTFASLPNGSTTGDAELIDIRVGANGTTYPTAGDSVRGQVSDLKSDLNVVSQKVGVVYPIFTANKNIYWVDSSTMWTYADYPNYIAMLENDMLHLTTGDKIVLSDVTGVVYSIFYHSDLSGNYVRKTTILDTPEYIIGEDGDYAICAWVRSGHSMSTTELASRFLINKREYIYNESIANNSIDTIKTNFINTSANLIDHMTIERGYVISPSGVKTVNSEYAITQKIWLKPNTKYTAKNLLRVSYFSADDTYINRADVPFGGGTFTTISGFDYVIVSLPLNAIYKTEWQLVEGETLPPFERQHLIVDGYRVYDDIDKYANKIDKFKAWDKICYDKSELFELATECDGLTAEDETTEAIISKYDALMSANSDYISKQAIGTASDGSTLYKYEFNSPNIPYDGSAGIISNNIKTKVILISGIHPEFGGIYGLYNALREITTNPSLEAIKFGVHFIVVPVVNPYACDTKSRKNANGVDLARNFSVDWQASSDPSSETYSGTSALSEPESQAVNQVMADNKDAIIFASCHSFQGTSEDTKAIWGSCATLYTTNLVGKLINKMSNAWRKKYEEVPDSLSTMLGYCETSAPNGSEGKQALAYGIQGLTLETCDYFRYNSANPLTSFVISRNAESYINFISIVLGCWESTDLKDLTKMNLLAF